ncbi:hypothetical protein ACHHYP_14164 [Achlya hypogyna]|uniref:Uncharacterized protein n=1 Tax=Achlya hypogyna TaxID=1202772 RepID=A0A1V9YDS8_ACHHY|nr:hypothetical protein ACHHYP_14164 [Achlya hypogyna]
MSQVETTAPLDGVKRDSSIKLGSMTDLKRDSSIKFGSTTDIKRDSSIKLGSMTDIKTGSASDMKLGSSSSLVSKRDIGSKSGIEIRAVTDAKPSEIVASSVVSSKDTPATKDEAAGDATSAAPKEDLAAASTPGVFTNDAPVVKFGDKIVLEAKCVGAPADGGVLRFVHEGKGKNAQRVLAVPPTTGEHHDAVFVIAPLAGTAPQSELCYNQYFYLHVLDAKGGVQSLNNDPPGAGESIGLQATGTKGEMTCYFAKPNNNSKVQFNDSDLVITVHDSNRTRKHFNNTVTYYKRLKGTLGGYISSAKKGSAVTFTIRLAPDAATGELAAASDGTPTTSRTATAEKASPVVSADDLAAAEEAQTSVEIAQPQAEAYVAPEVVLSPPTLKQESSEIHDDDVVKMDTKSSVIQHNEARPPMADGPVVVPPVVSPHLAAMKPVSAKPTVATKSLVLAQAKAVPRDDNADNGDGLSPAACAACCTIS